MSSGLTNQPAAIPPLADRPSELMPQSVSSPSGMSDAESLAPQWLLSRISLRELRRRMWHIAPGFLPFILWYYPHRDPISPTLRWILILIVVGLATWMITRFGRIRRKGEVNGTTAVVGYSASVLATLFLFPAHAEIGLAVLAILAFGDGSATLGGLLLRGPALPWNGDKSWAGLMSFIGAGLPMTTIIYWGETHNLEALDPGVSLTTALCCVAPAVMAASLVESIRSRLNDNLRVGLTSACAIFIARGFLLGW